MSSSITIGRPGQFREFELYCARRMEQAILRASAQAARAAVTEVRAGLPGRLKNAIGVGSDLAKSGRAFPRGQQISASGWLHIRGRSPRTVGAIISATEGGTIRARNGRWLAIATDQIPAKAGRQRMTPKLYRSTGLEQRIGPLVFVQGRNRNEALLIAKGPLTVDRFGRRGSARRLGKTGRHSPRRRQVDQVIAFVLIRQTSRARRVDVASIMDRHAKALPTLIAAVLRKET